MAGRPPLIIDPMGRAVGYHARRLARHEERRRRRTQGGYEEPWSDQDEDIEEEVDELPDADEDQIGKRKHVRGGDDKRDRTVQARQREDDTVEWVDIYTPADPQTAPPYEVDFYNLETWTASGPGSVTTTPGDNVHPGRNRIATGGTSGNQERFHQGTAAADTLLYPSNFDMTWIVSPVEITNVIMRVGLSADWSANPPASGVYFEFDVAAASTWHYVGRASGSGLFDINSAITVAAGTWYRFRLRNRVEGATSYYYFSIDGGAETQVSGGVINIAMQPGVSIRTTNNVTKRIDLDYYRYQAFGIGR